MAKVDPQNMSVRKIDLSDSIYHSDGVPGHATQDMAREDDASFLERLTKAFNDTPHLVAAIGKFSISPVCL